MLNGHYDQGQTTLSDFVEKIVWIAWRTEPRGNTFTKVPYTTARRKAESNNPDTWLDIDTALQVSEEIRGNLPDGKYGIGAFLGFDTGNETRLGGIDLDTCVTDGKIDAWAQEIIDRFGSYSEISPSRTGIKIFFRYHTADHARLRDEAVLRQGGGGAKAAHNKVSGAHPPAIEMYLSGRYFAITGQGDGLPQFIRTVDYAELVWLIEDAMPRFVDLDPSPKQAKTYSNGFDAATQSRPEDRPHHKDSSRSGIAFSKVIEWRSRAVVLNFDEMVEKLLADPDTTAWADSYKHERGQRQFHRVWERSRKFVNWTEHELAKAVREKRERHSTGGSDDEIQVDEIHTDEEIRAEEIHRDKQESAGASQQAQWPEPVDLFGNLTPEPVISRDMLPIKIGDYVWEQSALLGCDAGAMAMAALTACSALASDKLKLMPKRHDSTYYESPRLWLLLTGEVSSKKTPLLNKVVAGPKEIEKLYRLEDARKMEAYRNAMAQYDLKRKIWDKQVADGDKDADQFGPQKPDKPPRRRLVTTDYTVEALAPILCDNPRGLLILLDEIMQLFGGFDAYKSGGVKKDRAATLELWNGGYRPVDRVRTTDDPIIVDNWGASITGGIQRAMLDQIGPKLVCDGLLQRFLIVPVEPAGQEADRRPNADVISTYYLLVKSLADFNPDETIIRLSEEAHQYRDKIEKLIEAFMVLPGLSEGFRGHAGKMGAIFSRVLLTMHVIECSPLFGLCDEKNFNLVSGDTAKRAYRLMTKFLIPHAVRQYARITDARGDQLYADVRWIAGHILARSVSKIDKRICQQVNRTFKNDPDRAQKALIILREANWTDNHGNVNPCVHELYSDCATHERKVRDEKITRIKRAKQNIKTGFDCE